MYARCSCTCSAEIKKMSVALYTSIDHTLLGIPKIHMYVRCLQECKNIDLVKKMYVHVCCSLNVQNIYL
jgi:hypothetical protein